MQLVKQVRNRPIISFMSIMRVAVLSYWTYWIYTAILPVIMIDEMGYYVLTLTPLVLITLDLILSFALYKFENASWILLLLLNVGVIIYSMDWVLGYIGSSAIFHISLIIISILQTIILLLSILQQE